MVSLTKPEREALLILFKDYQADHNAHTLSKILDISHAGMQKLCKRLVKANVVTAKHGGKAIIYKPNLQDDYTTSLIIFLLADEAKLHERWQEEFKELNKEIVLFYGSAISNYNKAKDIDIMIITESDEKEIDHIIKLREMVNIKPFHVIKLRPEDFRNNIRETNKTIENIIKHAIILYGQAKYVELIKCVTSN